MKDWRETALDFFIIGMLLCFLAAATAGTVHIINRVYVSLADCQPQVSLE